MGGDFRGRKKGGGERERGGGGDWGSGRRKG